MKRPFEHKFSTHKLSTLFRICFIAIVFIGLEYCVVAGPPNPTNPILGVDQSTESQYYIDSTGWHQIYDQGYRFAFIRSSVGYQDIAPFHDVHLADQFRNSRDENPGSDRSKALLTGAYHVAYPAWGTSDDTPQKEADLFFTVAGAFMAPSTATAQGYLRPVLDIEKDIDHNGVVHPYDDYTKWVSDFSSELDAKIYGQYHVHVQPIIYTYPDFASRHFPSASLALVDITNYTLWISNPPDGTSTPGGDYLTVAKASSKREVVGCFRRPSSTLAPAAAASRSAKTATPRTGSSGPSAWCADARLSSSPKASVTTRSSRIKWWRPTRTA